MTGNTQMTPNIQAFLKSVDRREFVGGSDARIIMGDDEAALSAYGGRSAARSNRKTYPAISSSSSGR